MDDTVKLLVWACRRQFLTGDDEETATGPAWLAERLRGPLGRDVLTLAVLEAQRAVEVDPELDGHYAACLELIAAFAADTRGRLEARSARRRLTATP